MYIDYLTIYILLYVYNVYGLQVITSKNQIVAEFQHYCIQTAKMYVRDYTWYPMPPSLHKVLCHGAQIVDSSFLPIGQLSEEALEATNTFFKRARLNNSRMCSRISNNEDIMHHLLISSDPLVSGLRRR